MAGEGDENELANFTPAFLWLLRDFYLTLEEDGRQARPHIPHSPQLRKHIPSSSGLQDAGTVIITRHSVEDTTASGSAWRQCCARELLQYYVRSL